MSSTPTRRLCPGVAMMVVIALVLASLTSCQAKDPVDPTKGRWGEWSQAGPCSATCGSGTREIRRTWIPGTGEVLTEPFESTKVYYCSNEDRPNCPRNGTWSGWSNWADCTNVCGGGKRNRQRECLGINYGGKACPGEKKETEDCNREPCPALPRNFNMLNCIKGTNFTCASKKMCIPKGGRCNQAVQCHDGSDEIGCPKLRRPNTGRVRYDLRNAAATTRSARGLTSFLCGTTAALVSMGMASVQLMAARYSVY